MGCLINSEWRKHRIPCGGRTRSRCRPAHARKRAVAHDGEAQFSTGVTPALGAGHPVDRVHRSSVPGGNPRFSPKISEVKATDQQRPAQAPAVEGPRASARAIGHRQAAQLQGCAPSGHAVRRPSHGPIREQPRRGFASTDATARATDAPVQIRCARAAVSLGPRTRAESLPGRATSTSVGAPALASDAGVRRMGCGDVCLLNDEGYRAIEGSSRPPLINLTVPGVELAGPSVHTILVNSAIPVAGSS